MIVLRTLRFDVPFRTPVNLYEALKTSQNGDFIVCDRRAETRNRYYISVVDGISYFTHNKSKIFELH